MTRKLFPLLAVMLLLTACKKDDTDFTAYTTDTGIVTTIYIHYDGTSATVTGDSQGVVSTSGADVTVNSQYADSLLLVLSGTTSDGSLLVNRTRKYGIQLNGVSITNADGPAINNQCKKSLFIHCAEGTTNTLADGTAYAEQSYDQKGTLFSEGQLYFLGAGTLTVNANCKNAIASDDYMVFCGDAAINTVTSETGSNGLKAKEGIWLNSGTLTVSVASAGGRGIKCDSVVVVTGGTTAITTSGDCIEETVDGVTDYSSAACIKCDYPFTMTGGTLTMTSTGDGGKGLNCDQDITVSGGTFRAVTTGENTYSKPKAVKSDTAITVSGGSFYAQVSKSWACDNGYEDDTITDNDELAAKRIEYTGTPSQAYISKKLVIINY